jgi:hypothetical protein
MNRKRTALVVLILLFVAETQSRAYSADNFAIIGGGDLTWSPPGGAGFINAGPDPISDNATLDDPRFLFASANVSARAAHGVIGGAIAGNFITAPGGGTLPFHPTVRASAFGDITFQGSTPTLQTSLNMFIHGGMSLDAFPASSFRYAAGQVSFRVEINGLATDFDSILDANVNSPTTFNQFSNLVIPPSLGNDFTVNGIGTTGLIAVPVGVPIRISLSLYLAFNFGAGAPAGIASFNGNFADTMSFATSGPVFNLPEGYTVNGFGIVDNHFSVPEPSGAILLVVFMGMLVFQRQAGRQPRLATSLAA